MEAAIDQAELFPFPTIAAKSRKRSALRVMMDAVAEHGPLVPQAFVHVALDVSRQRAHELITDGRIATLEIGGKNFVPLAALDVFMSDERANGRPIADTRDHSLGQLWRRARAK